VVLVNRGWGPRNASVRTELPPVGQPAGAVAIEGVAVPHVPRLLDLGAEPAAVSLPAIWQNLDFETFERASGLRVARLVVQQTSSLDDGLLRQWARPETGVDKHRGYALQWYGLAALITVLTFGLGFRALRRRRAGPGAAA
jgi:cytochrome oxidase assembly protein ShyY1